MAPQNLEKLRIDLDRRTIQGRKNRRFYTWIAVIGIFLLTLIMLWFTGRLSSPKDIQTIKVVPTYASKALTLLNASGYVVAQRKAAVSSKATGRLQNLYVEEGKVVKNGDILANLENADLEATLSEAKAALRVAKAMLANAEAELEDASLNFNRQKALRGSGSVSVQSFDTAEARYKKAVAGERVARFGVEKAEAAIRISEVNLEYSLIRAPFDGVILTKNADIGEVVAPFGASLNAKAAVATMADMQSLMVEVDVAESSIEKVKIGAPTEIRLDALPNDRFDGTVHMIVPTADRAKATVMTKLKFDSLDPRILPEMSAKAAFLSRRLQDDEKIPFLGVPATAIESKNDITRVYIIRQNVAQAKDIKPGRTWNGTVEVTSGLQEGDVIALDPKVLKDGDRVRVKE